MKRSTFVITSLLLAALCLAAFAQDARQAGKVVSVDMAKNELTIKEDQGNNQTLRVSSETKITKNGRDVTLAEVKVNDRVLYEYDETTGSTLKSLTVVAATKPDQS